MAVAIPKTYRLRNDQVISPFRIPLPEQVPEAPPAPVAGADIDIDYLFADYFRGNAANLSKDGVVDIPDEYHDVPVPVYDKWGGQDIGGAFTKVDQYLPHPWYLRLKEGRFHPSMPEFRDKRFLSGEHNDYYEFMAPSLAYLDQFGIAESNLKENQWFDLDRLIWQYRWQRFALGSAYDMDEQEFAYFQNGKWWIPAPIRGVRIYGCELDSAYSKYTGPLYTIWVLTGVNAHRDVTMPKPTRGYAWRVWLTRFHWVSNIRSVHIVLAQGIIGRFQTETLRYAPKKDDGTYDYPRVYSGGIHTVPSDALHCPDVARMVIRRWFDDSVFVPGRPGYYEVKNSGNTKYRPQYLQNLQTVIPPVGQAANAFPYSQAQTGNIGVTP